MNQIINELIKFYLNKDLFKAKRIKKEEKLFKVRQILGIDLPEKSFFILPDGTLIEKEDEINIELNDILDKNNIYLIHNKNNSINLLNQIEKKNKLKLFKKGINKDFPEWLLSQNKIKENIIIPKELNNFISPDNKKRELKYISPPIKYSNLKVNNYIKKENLKNDIKNNIKIIGRKIPSISSCIKIEQINNLDIYLYPKFNFYDFEEKKALSFIVVGETGSGKTTLLNSFVNFLLGVKINDDYRYKIIFEKGNKTQSNSQTEQVNIYNIRSVGGIPPIKIIDTPGFGDTEGIEKDNEIIEQIEKFFRDNLKEINAICFVTKSTNNRLTFYQKYILNKVLDIFGKDVIDNFIFLLTFCDGGLPNIIEPLKSSESPFKEIINSKKDSTWFFKFNNSSFYESERSDEYTKIFWDLGIKNFNDFLYKLKNLKKINLNLTKEVLYERKILEKNVKILNEELKKGLNKINELKKINNEILIIENELNETKGYENITTIPLIKKINKNINYYSTTCLICNITCHSNCEIVNDDEKSKCNIMDKNGFCTICPKKCKWNEHKNRNYILKEIHEENIIILEDLKKRYFDNKNKIEMKKKLFNETKEEIMKINDECIKNKELIDVILKKIENIALKGNIESYEEFFDILIEIEKSEYKPGWENRIRTINSLKEEKILLREIYLGKNSYLNQIKEFLNNELNNYNYNKNYI